MKNLDNPMAALPRHTISYRILNNYRPDPIRNVEVYASPEEIMFFREQGYLVRESLFTPAQTERLRAALQEVADHEIAEGRASVSTGAGFGGCSCGT